MGIPPYSRRCTPVWAVTPAGKQNGPPRAGHFCCMISVRQPQGSAAGSGYYFRVRT